MLQLYLDIVRNQQQTVEVAALAVAGARRGTGLPARGQLVPGHRAGTDLRRRGGLAQLVRSLDRAGQQPSIAAQKQRPGLLSCRLERLVSRRARERTRASRSRPHTAAGRRPRRKASTGAGPGRRRSHSSRRRRSTRCRPAGWGDVVRMIRRTRCRCDTAVFDCRPAASAWQR